jgi:hypothetical protein
MSQELSEVFYTFLITSTIGLLIGIARICYKSKCKTVDMCCLKIVRDVDIEKEEMQMAPNNLESSLSTKEKV